MIAFLVQQLCCPEPGVKYCLCHHLVCLQVDGTEPASTRLAHLPPVKRRSRASQDGPGPSNSKDKGKLGSPIKLPATAVRRLSLSSTTADPLEGNPNFQALQALTPGASSSVFLCLDHRDQVYITLEDKACDNDVKLPLLTSHGPCLEVWLIEEGYTASKLSLSGNECLHYMILMSCRQR